MAALRVVPRLLRFAALSAARTVSTQAVGVPKQGASSLVPLLKATQGPRQTVPFAWSYPYRQLSSTSEEERRWDDVHLDEFQRLLKEEDTYVIDVREPWELEQYGRFPESVNIPLGDVVEALELNDDDFEHKYGRKKPSRKSDGIIFHCMGGIRSRRVLDAAHELGYSSARHYIGGWEEWSSQVLGRPIDQS